VVKVPIAERAKKSMGGVVITGGRREVSVEKGRTLMKTVWGNGNLHPLRGRSMSGGEKKRASRGG